LSDTGIAQAMLRAKVARKTCMFWKNGSHGGSFRQKNVLVQTTL